MKFTDLPNKRRLAIQILINEYPEVAKTGTITLAQLKIWWESKYSKLVEREIGYPIWIFSEQAFRSTVKGHYTLPLPQSDAEWVTASTKTVKKIKTPKIKTLKDLTPVLKECKIVVSEVPVFTEEEFNAECIAAGIIM